MAHLEIKITNTGSGKLVAHDTFEIAPEIAADLIDTVAAVIAEMPGQAGVRHLRKAGGAKVVDVTLLPEKAGDTFDGPTFRALSETKERKN